MYKLFKNLAGISIFYSLANSLEAVSPFFLAIILTRFLRPDEYGIWVLFLSLVAFSRPFVNLTIQDALRMNFYEMDAERRGTFVISAFYLSTASTVLLGLGALAFAEPLSALLKFPAGWIVSIVAAAYLYVIFYFILAYNQFAEKRRQFIALQFIQSALSLAFITVLLWRGMGWQGVIVGKILGLLLPCVIGMAWMAGGLKLDLRAHCAQQIKGLVRFGLTYLPTGLGLVAVPLTDRLIITHVLGLGENGLYGVAALFGAALFVAINGFLHAWMPWLFQRLRRHDGDYRTEVFAISTGFLLLLPVAGVIFYLVSMLIAPTLIGEAFTRSFPLISWAIAGTVAMGYFYHNQAFLHFKKAVVPMSVSSLNCILLNAILSYYGAIYYGVAGVLAATIVAYGVSALVTGIFIVDRFNIVSIRQERHA